MQKLRSRWSALWDSLFDVNQPPARYLGRALLLDLPITLPLAVLVGLAFPRSGPDFSSLSPWALLFATCVFSPVIETGAMAVLFRLLRLAVKPTTHLAILSTIAWALLHSLGAPAWGLGVIWPFLIFSICYLRWETKSPSRAFIMTTLLHALHNVAPALLVIAGTGLDQ